MISEKGEHFGTLKISVFIEIGVVFRLKSANTDGLHKFLVSGGTGAVPPPSPAGVKAH